MKFQIENKKLQDMLNYLKVDTLFKSCIFSTKDRKLYSSQTEEYGYLFRFALFDQGFFKSISDEKDSVKINVEAILKIIKNINPNEILTVKYIKDTCKLNIKGLSCNINITEQLLDESEIKKGLIFKMDKGIPILKSDTDNPVRLDNKITIKLKELKAVTRRATALETNFYTFNVDKNKNLEIRIGDLHDASDYDVYKPRDAIIQTKEEISAIFTKGIYEISKTITAENVELNIKTNSPIWIASIGKNYRLGFLLPPYLGEEEEGD